MSRHESLSPQAEKLYRSAVARGRLSMRAASEVLGEGQGREVVRELVAQGLLEQTGDDLLPRSPRLVLESMAAAQSRAHDRTRQLVIELGRLWDERADPPSFIEVLTHDGEVQDTHLRLLREAETRVRGLSIGPVGAADQPRPSGPPQVAAGFEESIARGITYRVVYGVRLLRDPDGLAAVQDCIRAGEEARVFPDVPINMILVDDRVGFLVSPGTAGARRHALIVRRSGLLDQLGHLFEAFWRMAVPIGVRNEPVEGGPGPDVESRRLLAYLSAGLTDDSIARELGVSERTVGRRVARLQEVLGAHSRFQLGVQASRQGWL